MADNFFDLDDSVNLFTIGAEIPSGAIIRGLGGQDLIVGSGNPDAIHGNTGADTLYGMDGNDTLQGGRGSDLLLGNRGDDLIFGERGNDVIFGGQGNDLLDGGVGDDFLAGDAGTDTLTGGDGSDAFVLDIRHGSSDRNLADVITDFSVEDGDVFAVTDGANDNLTEADLTLETVGTETFISLTATGEFLARVQGVTAEELTGTFSTVRATRDDTESGATVLNALPGQTSIQGQVGETDYQDFFELQVTETSIVDLSLTGLTADADLFLYQDLDADGELGGDEIISASSRWGNADEAIENVTLDQGRYFIGVEQFEGDTSYNLSISGVAGTVARDLAGSEPSTARLLPPDGEVELHDYLGGTDAVDTYRLEVLNGGYLDLFTTYQEADLNLTLWSDTNGNNQLDADETIAQGTNEIQQDVISPGTYYVNVTALGAGTAYEILSISEPGSRVGIESYNPLFPGVPTTGTLDQNDAFDFNDDENYADPYLLSEIGAGLTVTITQESKDFDAYLTVVDLITGEVIAENDDIDTEGGNFNAQVSFTSEQGGQYVVYASSVDSPGIGEYTLNTRLTGTVTQTVFSSDSASSDDQSEEGSDSLSSSSVVSTAASSISDQLPPPIFNEEGDRADTGLTQDVLHNLVYQPLTGGLITPIQLNNLNQGNFGNCAFIAALAATFGKIEDPSTANLKQSEVLNSAITTDGSNYTLKFYNYLTSQPGNVMVNNQVVTKDDNLFGATWDNLNPVEPTEASGQRIWGAIFERAYAKWRGQETGKNGYDVMGNGDVGGRSLKRVTGKAIQEISWDPSQSDPEYSLIQFSQDIDGSYNNLGSITQEEIFNRIQTALNEGRYVMTGTISEAEKLSQGALVGGHAYSVHNAYEMNGRKMILVRNPWGTDTSKGAVDNLNDGFVAITFETFLNNFDGVSLSQADSP